MTAQWGSRWPWTAAIARLSRIRRLELIAAVVTAAVVLPFILTPGTAEGVEVTLEPASDAIVLGQIFTLTAIIDIPVDQFVSSIEIEVAGPANFTVPVPLRSGPFDLSDAPGVSGQLTGDVEFPADGFGYGYSFGYGYGYGDFDGESGFGYGYGFGDGFGSGYGYGYGDGAPGGPIVLTIQYTPVVAGTYVLRVRVISSLQDGPPIVTEGEVTFTVVPPPPPPPPPPPGSKVTLCHIPPGNPANAHLITVGAPAVKAHLRHGDVVTTVCPSLAKDDKSAKHTAPGLETTLCDPADGSSVPAVLITVGAPAVKVHKAKDKTKGNASAAACSSPDDGESLIPTVQGGKALLCHVSGNPATSRLISVPLRAIKGHLAHGDLASGACPSGSDGAPSDGNEVETAPLSVIGGGGSSTPSAGGDGIGPSGKGQVAPKSPRGSGKSSGKPTDQAEGEAKVSPPGNQKEKGPTGPGKKAPGGKWKAKGRPFGNGSGEFLPPGKQKGNKNWSPPGQSKKVGDGEIGPGGKWKAKGPPPGKGKGAQSPGKKKGKKK